MWTIFFHDNTSLTTHYEKPEKSGNLKFNSKGQGIRLKSEGKYHKFSKVMEKRELCFMEFIFSQFEDSHFKIFWGAYAHILLWGSQ